MTLVHLYGLFAFPKAFSRIDMVTRKRLSPEESRSTALAAARALLIESGPQSVTLKAVSARIGRTHANLLHHFGSASGLQKALAEHLARSVCETIIETVRASRAGLSTSRDVADLAFDAFDREGAGALTSWMLLTGNDDALDPIISTIHDLVEELAPDETSEAAGECRIHRDTLTLVLMALGDALIGGALAKSLGLTRDAARERAAAMLEESLAVYKRCAS